MGGELPPDLFTIDNDDEEVEAEDHDIREGELPTQKLQQWNQHSPRPDQPGPVPSGSGTTSGLMSPTQQHAEQQPVVLEVHVVDEQQADVGERERGGRRDERGGGGGVGAREAPRAQ